MFQLAFHAKGARHRVTLTHGLHRDDPVSELSPLRLRLKNIALSREDRYTVPVPTHPRIGSLRAHVQKAYNATETTQFFNYDGQYGTHFHVTRKNASVDKDAMLADAGRLIEEHFGVHIEPQNWVLAYNAYYFHLPQVVVPPLPEPVPHLTALEYSYFDGVTVLKTFEAQLQRNSVDLALGLYTEIGVFGRDLQSEPHDLVPIGARIMFNEAEPSEEYVQRTMIHVKPRNRHLPHVAVELRQNGLHPVVTLAEPETPSDPDLDHCKLYTYWTLHRLVFLDPYQLPPHAKVVANYGTRDLELPEYKLDTWGNEVLVEHTNASFPLEVTLHARYQLPQSSPHTPVTFAKPALFWACQGDSDGYVLNLLPFDNRQVIGGSWEKLFGNDTIYYHASDRGTFALDVPNALGSASVVYTATFAAVLLGFAIVARALWRKPTAPSLKKTQ